MNGLEGCQAEYVRQPLADGSLYVVPEGADEASLSLLADIFSTGFSCAHNAKRLRTRTMRGMTGPNARGSSPSSVVDR
jgi:threonine dehydrogenase-like Zn-dependent dehydrogenase